MKFLHYAALIATTSAIRLQATQVEPSFETLMGVDKEVPSPEDVWKHFDANNDGQWSLAEAQAAFKGAMEYFGHALKKGWKSKVAKEFKKADTNGNGTVSPKEMGVYLFKLVDENEDGEIQIDELYNAIEAIAEFSGNELIDGWKEDVFEAVKHVDTDKSGGASMSELMKAIEEHGIPDINDLFKDKDAKLKLSDLLRIAKNHVPTAQEIWDHFDTNGDNQISIKEALKGVKKAAKMYNKELPKGWRKYIKAEFKKADTDNSGTVSKKELAATVFQAIDGNDDGVISLDEMKGAVKYIAKVSENKLIADWEAKVEAAFKYVDANGDGEVSSKEAWKALKKHGLDMNGLFE